MAKLVEKTYGDALFELAMEKGNLDTYFSQCKDILQAILDNEELLKLLSHPKITKEEKVKVIEDVFAGRVDDDITGFFVLIVKKDRQTELLQILEYFIDIKIYYFYNLLYVLFFQSLIIKPGMNIMIV